MLQLEPVPQLLMQDEQLLLPLPNARQLALQLNQFQQQRAPLLLLAAVQFQPDEWHFQMHHPTFEIPEKPAKLLRVSYQRLVV